VYFRVLGPLDVRDDDGLPLVPPRRKQRLLLALLLLSANEALSTARLVDELWPGPPPRSAGTNLQSYVSGLRRLLGSATVPGTERIHTQRGGYLLRVGDDELDASEFERLERTGRRLLRDGDPAAGSELLARALGLWRGRVLEDLHLPEGRQPQLARLEERRLAVVEDRVEAHLALGWHADIAAELRALTRTYPMRERLWEQLMLALYRGGRQADALAAYQEAYRLLGAELGIEPGGALRRLHQRILRGDATLDAPAGQVRVAAAQGPRELPLDVTDFTGRVAPLATLDELLRAGADTDRVAAVATIAGTAGVGKTALAVHWAHRAAADFPDGQLYANLHGYATTPPTEPIEVLTRFLRALGVPPERVPAGLDEAAAMYRSRLADRRVLVVLDNVATPEQARPLLPGSPGSKVVITSRDRLSGLVALDGARRVNLDVLTADEAAELIARVVGGDRVAAAPAAATELARLCAHLPLALRVAATTLLDRPGGTVADLVAELSTADRLSVLAVGGSGDVAVRAAFDLSYAALTDPARRLFRLLGSCPAEDFTEPAAAVLAGLDAGQAGPLLDRLAGAHLLDARPAGRFGCHDLLRLYAAERSRDTDPEPDRSASQDRLLTWYVETGRAAVVRLSPDALRLPGQGGRPDAFDSPAAAAAWLDAERHNLVAVARHAGALRSPVAAKLSDALRGYFRQRRCPVDWLAVAHAGVAGAAAANDRRVPAAAHLSLAEATSFVGDLDAGVRHYRLAAELSRLAGWPEGEAAAISGHGSNREIAGRVDEALGHFTRALAINRSNGLLAGQARNLSSIGLSYVHLGRPDRAAEHLTEAVAIERRAGIRAGRAHTLNRLGMAYHAMGQLALAVARFEEALVIAREFGDHVAEAATLDSLAVARRDLGDLAAARAAARAAVELTEDTAQHASSAYVHNTLATIELCLGDVARARDRHAKAVTLARESSSRLAECEALIGLSAAHRTLGSVDLAVAYAEEALNLARDGALRSAALVARADADLARGRPAAAAGLVGEALAAARDSGQRLGEARALVVSGRACAAVGRTALAAPRWHEARQIFIEAGAATEAERVACLLAEVSPVTR